MEDLRQLCFAAKLFAKHGVDFTDENDRKTLRSLGRALPPLTEATDKLLDTFENNLLIACFAGCVFVSCEEVLDLSQRGDRVLLCSLGEVLFPVQDRFVRKLKNSWREVDPGSEFRFLGANEPPKSLLDDVPKSFWEPACSAVAAGGKDFCSCALRELGLISLPKWKEAKWLAKGFVFRGWVDLFDVRLPIEDDGTNNLDDVLEILDYCLEMDTPRGFAKFVRMVIRDSRSDARSIVAAATLRCLRFRDDEAVSEVLTALTSEADGLETITSTLFGSDDDDEPPAKKICSDGREIVAVTCCKLLGKLVTKIDEQLKDEVDDDEDADDFADLLPDNEESISSLTRRIASIGVLTMALMSWAAKRHSLLAALIRAAETSFPGGNRPSLHGKMFRENTARQIREFVTASGMNSVEDEDFQTVIDFFSQ